MYTEDLREILPEEWFNEIIEHIPNENDLEEIESSFYKSDCPELMGDFQMYLFIDQDNQYFVKRSTEQRKGWSNEWNNEWFKCTQNKKLHELLEG